MLANKNLHAVHKGSFTSCESTMSPHKVIGPVSQRNTLWLLLEINSDTTIRRTNRRSEYVGQATFFARTERQRSKRSCQQFQTRALLYVEKCFQKVWCPLRNWRLALQDSNEITLTWTTKKKRTIIPKGHKLIMQKCSDNSWSVEDKGQQGNFHYTAQNYRETFK
jgi:hypothetical protein